MVLRIPQDLLLALFLKHPDDLESSSHLVHITSLVHTAHTKLAESEQAADTLPITVAASTSSSPSVATITVIIAIIVPIIVSIRPHRGVHPIPRVSKHTSTVVITIIASEHTSTSVPTEHTASIVSKHSATTVSSKHTSTVVIVAIITASHQAAEHIHGVGVVSKAIVPFLPSGRKVGSCVGVALVNVEVGIVIRLSIECSFVLHFWFLGSFSGFLTYSY